MWTFPIPINPTYRRWFIEYLKIATSLPRSPESWTEFCSSFFNILLLHYHLMYIIYLKISALSVFFSSQTSHVISAHCYKCCAQITKQNSKKYFGWRALCLQTTTTTTALPASRIGWDGSNILDAANFHWWTSQSTQRRLGAGSRGLCLVATGCTQFNVQSCDAEGLAPLSHILKHKIEFRTITIISLTLYTLPELPT